jgi:hypoxanthine phosphoribosyltransferase
MRVMDDLIPRHDATEIEAAVKRMAAEISRDYEGSEPLLVGVLLGSFVFVADLTRAMTIPCQVDFIRARSYGKTMESSGAVEITKDIETDIADRHVIIVEDILDTGLTIDFVTDRIKAGHPASVAICALLVREGTALPEYHGFVTPKGFVVGYGIDYAERYRSLPDIWAVAGTEGG